MDPQPGALFDLSLVADLTRTATTMFASAAVGTALLTLVGVLQECVSFRRQTARRARTAHPNPRPAHGLFARFAFPQRPGRV
jgi:hypothetical protein